MNCPNCGAENRDEDRYCVDCGAELVEARTVADLKTENSQGLLKAGSVLKEKLKILEVICGGVVNRYLAEDPTRGKVSVLEMILGGEGEADPLAQQWDLLRELGNGRLVRALDYFRVGDKAYLVLESSNDMSLDELLKVRSEPFSQDEVLKWGIELCEAVALLHKSNVLHRDIQPANIRVSSEGKVRLGGLERICPAGSCPERYLVTPGFSSPEAYGMHGAKLDFRSDVYSIGATLYALLAGKSPSLEQRESFFAFPPMRELRPEINPRLEEVIIRAVSREPEGRFAGVEELKDALIFVMQESERVARSVQRRKMRLLLGMRSDVGKVRRINQDSCMVVVLWASERSEHTKVYLLVVADGMGGEVEGEKASSLAIRALARYMMENYLPIYSGSETRKLLSLDQRERSREILGEALKEANRVVHQYSLEDRARRGMGATITCALVEDDQVTFAHAGDTRAYLIDESIEQVTEDHSLVARLVKMGQMKMEEALASPQRSLVYRALGTGPDLEVEIYQNTLKAGQYLFLCSDGVWEYFTDQEILQIFEKYRDPQAICEALVSICLEKGADDNCTALVARLELEEQD